MKSVRGNIILIAYLMLLGITAGAILVEGVIVAPVVFNASDYLHTMELSRFQSGLLMTEVFVRTNVLLNLTATMVLIYELWYFLKRNREWVGILSGLTIVTTSYLFTFYFTPMVLEAQKLGEKMAEDASFNTVHKASELDFKILLIALIVLFCVRAYKAASGRL